MPSDALPQLTPVSLDISKITCRCSVWRLPRRDKGEAARFAGLIAFRGVYPPGSRGAEDARFIRWRIREFCELQEPVPIAGLVVDFRDLHYEWGDDLDYYPRWKREHWPTRVLVRPEQFEAFRGALGAEDLRTDAAEAFSEVAREAAHPPPEA